METVLSYAYVDVSVRKHGLSKKITAPVMSAAINNLLDKLEFANQFICQISFGHIILDQAIHNS